MTSAVANAIAITLDRQARSAYDRRVRLEDGDDRPPQTAAEFGATAGRLASMFPGAVKVH